MNNQKIKNLLKDPNTNWKYVALVAIVAALGFGAILTYQNLWPTDQETSLPEIVVPKKEIPEIPANWKTYRNEEYGFEVKYPGEWYQCEHIYPLPPGVDFAPFSIPDIRAGGGVFGVEVSSRTFGDQIAVTKKFTSDITSEESVIIDGFNGVRINYGYTDKLSVVLVDKENKTYMLQGFVEVSNAPEWGKFDQIVSTFRFLE